MNNENEIFYEKRLKHYCDNNDLDGLQAEVLEIPDCSLIKSIYADAVKVLIGERFSPLNSSRFRSNLIASVSYQDWMPNHLKGVSLFNNLIRNEEVIDLSVDNSFFGSVTELSELDGFYDNVVCVSCDNKYFDKYFDGFFESFYKAREGTDALHVHLVNPKKEDIDYLLTGYSYDFLAITVEFLDVFTNAYYTLGRFFVAKNYVKKGYYAITVDIDSKFNMSPSKALPKALKGDKIHCRRTPPPSLPWQTWMAGFVLIPPVKVGFDFVDEYSFWANYLLKNKVDEMWYIDQNILTFLWAFRGFRYFNNWAGSSRMYSSSVFSKYRSDKVKLRTDKSFFQDP